MLPRPDRSKGSARHEEGARPGDAGGAGRERGVGAGVGRDPDGRRYKDPRPHHRDADQVLHYPAPPKGGGCSGRMRRSPVHSFVEQGSGADYSKGDNRAADP